MKNMERQKFEDSWKEAFTDAEQAAPDQVWTNVEQQLIQAESGTMKRRVVFYQRIAAASVLLALAFGAVATYYAGYYDGKNNSETELVSRQGDKDGSDGNGIEESGNTNTALNSDSSASELTRRSLEETNSIENNERLANNSEEGKDNSSQQEIAEEKSDKNTVRKPGKNNRGIDNNTDNPSGKNKLNEADRSNLLAANSEEGKANSNQQEIVDEKSDKNSVRKPGKDGRSVDNNVKKPSGKRKFDDVNRSSLLAKNEEQQSGNDALEEKEFTRRSVTYEGLASLKGMPEEEVQVKGKPRMLEIARKLPAMPSSFMNNDSKKGKDIKEQLWASVGASAGNYSPHVNSGVTPQRSFDGFNSSAALPQNSNSSSSVSPKGSAYSFGVNVGTKISKRWLIQGGLAYMNQSVGYTSNFAAIDQNSKAMAYVADYAERTEYANTMSTPTPYEINSVNEFVSFPVQAGYLLLDRKFGIQINSGIATDFFMQNTLTDKSGRLEKLSENAGEESPYRSVSWSGLMGTEFSYKLGTQYRVSVAPGMRYSIGSVLKSGAAPGNPLVWDMGFRFRYIFK